MEAGTPDSSMKWRFKYHFWQLHYLEPAPIIRRDVGINSIFKQDIIIDYTKHVKSDTPIVIWN